MTSYYNDACVEVDETKADLDKIYAKMWGVNSPH
jgi:hypothetical protein